VCRDRARCTFTEDQAPSESCALEPGCDGPQVENNSTLNRISEHTALKGRKRADVPVYLWVLAFITPDRFSGLQGIELIQPQPTRSRFCSDRSRKGLRSVGSSCGPFSPLADHDELAIQFPSVTRRDGHRALCSNYPARNSLSRVRVRKRHRRAPLADNPAHSGTRSRAVR
jgi:hypothetical protein